jgi:hypothetical protein
LSRINIGDGELLPWEYGAEGVNMLGKGFSIEVVMCIRAAIMVQTL